MKAALFAMTDVDRVRATLSRLREEHREATWTVFAHAAHLDRLATAFPDCVFRPGKPAGSRLGFLRAVRREGFDLVVVTWHGGERLEPLRVAALFAGARRTVACDERDHCFAVGWYLPWTWGRHALRRLVDVRGATILLLLAASYRATLGIMVAVLALSLFRLRHGRVRPGA